MIELIKKFKQQEGSVTFSGTKETDIKKAGEILAKQDFSPLPDEYKDFLKITDGLIYDGIEFFGIDYHYRKEKDYYFPDILTINKHYQQYNYFTRKVILGRLSESLITYNEIEKTFVIVDRIKLVPRQEFSSLNELLEFLLSVCYTD